MTRKNTHGMAATRPPTARTAAWMSQFTVPLLDAIAEQVRDADEDHEQVAREAEAMSSSDTPKAAPTTNAATIPSTPMLTRQRRADHEDRAPGRVLK